MAAFLISVALGSFLLFQVQPLIGRYILPWFGGGPAIWTTCMLFFQVMLLVGYSYAHALTACKRKTQGFIHAGLLAIAVSLLPIEPSPQTWKPSPESDPVAAILMLLLANVGVPFLALAATAPLLQHWFSRSFPERSPYRLYALSNFASLLALLSYPFLVEPHLALHTQVTAWGWGFAIFAAGCGWCALHKDAGAEAAADAPPAASGAGATATVSPGAISLWLILSACGSALLLAVTNQLCQEVAVVPFLWVAPLALYLLTYAICFNGEHACNRGLWGTGFVLALVPICWLLHVGAGAKLQFQAFGYLAALFIFCMACHGELYRARPEPRHLTLYYLSIAAGGALGGVSVALAAPLLFRGFWELPVAVTVTTAALFFAWHRDGALKRTNVLVTICVAVALAAQAAFTLGHIRQSEMAAVASSRNFYGVLKVVRQTDAVGEKLYLQHGRIMHGSQYCDTPLRNLPTTYYGPESGAALALRLHPRRSSEASGERAIKVGIIGLGVGTLAVYGESGDIFRFYEINGAVTAFADRYFTYRRDSKAGIETVPGDARISLESEYLRKQPQRFDVLVVDAFSSDSIPAHLLTSECFNIYSYHLKPDSLLLVHVTNRFLNLVPVVQAQAKKMGLEAVLVRSTEDNERGVSPASWMILTRNLGFLNLPDVKLRLATDAGKQPSMPLWTDDYVSLWHILKW